MLPGKETARARSALRITREPKSSFSIGEITFAERAEFELVQLVER